MNPCPCGHAGDPQHACVCAESDVQRYRARLSGPLLDRIDMHVTVGAVPMHLLGDPARSRGEASADIRARVERARAVQRARFASRVRAACNAQASGRWLDMHGGLSRDARAMLTSAADALRLSARAYHRVIKVARTIADLAAEPGIGSPHVAEALGYRPR
jgi:magnesium chelatase family protein